jgi:hypothetical protein
MGGFCRDRLNFVRFGGIRRVFGEAPGVLGAWVVGSTMASSGSEGMWRVGDLRGSGCVVEGLAPLGWILGLFNVVVGAWWARRGVLSSSRRSCKILTQVGFESANSENTEKMELALSWSNRVFLLRMRFSNFLVRETGWCRGWCRA